MKQEHLTPNGWKPCNASARKCMYETRTVGDEAPAFIEAAVEEVEAGKPNAIKNFFNNLFNFNHKNESRSLSESPLPTAKVSPTPASVSTHPALSKVVQTENGLYEVTCYDAWRKANLTHKFGDLIQTKAAAEKLHNADPKKDYQLGECGVIAGELWNRSEHVKDYYILKTDTDPDFGTHHFVQLNDGTIADSMGLWTEQAFLGYWKEIDPTVRISTFDVEEEPEFRNPDFTVSNLELFNTVNDLINKHMAGQKL